MLLTTASGSLPRYGPTSFSRYARAAASGSMFSACNPATPGISVGVPPSLTPKTSSRFEAGSVLTSSTRFPLSASAMADAQASDVLPTPPLPVKNRKRVGDSKKRPSDCSVAMFILIQHEPPQQQLDFAGVALAAAFNLNSAANSLRSG